MVKVLKNESYYIFEIDRSGANGALSCSHETSVYFNINTGEWSGDEINYEGWVDLDEGEVMTLVDHYDLKSYIKEK